MTCEIFSPLCHRCKQLVSCVLFLLFAVFSACRPSLDEERPQLSTVELRDDRLDRRSQPFVHSTENYIDFDTEDECEHFTDAGETNCETQLEDAGEI
jgi:hypothetical protein